MKIAAENLMNTLSIQLLSKFDIEEKRHYKWIANVVCLMSSKGKIKQQSSLMD